MEKQHMPSRFIGKTTEETFTEIYQTNHWTGEESISGPGSALAQTKTIIQELNLLLKTLDISTMLDLPCGDFNWMQRVKLSSIEYIGADIVDALIETNVSEYSNAHISFIKKDLITDSLPKVDLILVRDCLVHFSYTDIRAALKNIKASGSKYLLTTTFTNRKGNRNIVTGEWRPINLQMAPFHFPQPILVINENCTEGNGHFKDKSLGLWNIEELNIN